MPKRVFTLTAFFALALSFLMPSSPVRAQEAEAVAEAVSPISFTGQLIELSSTDAPTTVVVRQDPEGAFTDFTVEISTMAVVTPNAFTMADWITGDFLAVEGMRNENTGVVSAVRIGNLSLNPFQHRGLNGWIESIDLAGSKLTVRWQDGLHVVTVTELTRMVVPPTNPAALSDFRIGDRVRLRLARGGRIENEARIVIALRRADEIFLKARTRSFRGILETLDAAGSTLTVRLSGNAHLRPDDVNNLVGVEGELVTVTWNEDTRVVRRYRGEASVDEFTPGDRLQIVGRVGDDGVIGARMIKNESIFLRGVARRLGQVLKVDMGAHEIVVLMARGDATAEWTVTYTEATKFMKNARVADESAVEERDIVRIVGVADAAAKTVAATQVFLYDETFRPIVRERPLREIVDDRIRTSMGRMSAEDIVARQEPVEAQEEDEDA